MSIHFFGKEKYKTTIGSIFGLFSLMIVITISYFFLYDLLGRNVMTITFNQDETSFPVVNLTNIPIMFTIADLSGNIVRPDKLYTFELNLVNVVIKKTDAGFYNPNLLKKSIPVEICNKDKHIPKEFSNYFNGFEFSNFYCVGNTSDLTLSGRYGQYYSNFSMFNIDLYRCVNSSLNNNSCYSEDYIDKKLTNVYFNFAFLNNYIDNFNTTQSKQMRLQTTTTEVMTSLLKRYNYLFNQVVYNTDYGFILQENYQENYFHYENYELDLISKNTGVGYGAGDGNEVMSSTANSYFLSFSFRCATHVFVYNRRFLKFQTFLANIGGVFKAVMVFSEIIVTIISRNFYLLDISNSIFFFKNENENFGENHKISLKIQNSEFNMLPIDTNKHKSFKLIFDSIQGQAHSPPINVRAYSPQIIGNETKNEEKLKLNWRELIFLKMCLKNKKRIIRLERCENFIVKNISIEYIIEKFNELEKIIKHNLDDDEVKSFKRNNKMQFFTNLNAVANRGDGLQEENNLINLININNLNNVNNNFKDFEILNNLNDKNLKDDNEDNIATNLKNNTNNIVKKDISKSKFHKINNNHMPDLPDNKNK